MYFFPLCSLAGVVEAAICDFIRLAKSMAVV
jgi:hypothetical protein